LLFPFGLVHLIFIVSPYFFKVQQSFVVALPSPKRMPQTETKVKHFSQKLKDKRRSLT